MKEPSVIIKNIVTPSASRSIQSERIVAGVIVADTGTIKPKLFRSKSELLKEFTIDGRITKSTDPTLIHAAAYAEFIPVLVTRSFNDDGARFGNAFLLNGAVSNHKVVYKNFEYLVDYCDVNLQNKEDLILRLGTKIYHTQASLQAPEGFTAHKIELSEFDGPKERSFINKINLIDQKFQIEFKSRTTTTTLLTVYGLSGSLPADSDTRKYENNEYFNYIYSTRTQLDPQNVLMYILNNNPGTRSYSASMKIVNKDSKLIELSVITPSKTYTYEGSLDSNYLNSYKVSQFIENINDYEGLPFSIDVVSEDITNITSPITIEFGASNSPKFDDIDSRTNALNRLTDIEDYKITYLVPMGYNNPNYIQSLTAKDEDLFSFTPCGLIVKRDDPEYIKGLAPKVSTNKLIVIAGSDRNSSVADFSVDLSSEVAYVRRIVVNTVKGAEYAPVLNKENGVLNIQNPHVQLMKSTRESLLDARIMSVVTKKSENISYLNKNKTTSTSDDVTSEEQNIRLSNRINQDVDELMQQFIGKYNDEATRSLVFSVLTGYFRDNIMNQVYSLEDYPTIICDETNNTPDIIAANRLVVDIKVVYNRAIYEVVIYHRAFDIKNSEGK